MPRKVMCGKEHAAGTVTEKLAKCLAEKGYIEDTKDDQERAGEAASDLPNGSRVLDLLDAYMDETAPNRKGYEIEDHFWIERIEPGKLWLKAHARPRFVDAFGVRALPTVAFNLHSLSSSQPANLLPLPLNHK